MSTKLVDVPASAPQKGKDELAGVKLQTLKPTDAAPVKVFCFSTCTRD